jgi:transcriptional regulator of acetoin/glycerol metabolism
VSGIAPALAASLQAHDWPGNVRELRNLVESVFIDPPDGQLELAHLAPAFQALFRQYRGTPDSELAHMIAVLEHHQWNKVEAAKELHCSRMTLYRKLAKYQVTQGPAVTGVTP